MYNRQARPYQRGTYRMDTQTSFGVWVRQRRRALDMLQKELADSAGCSTATLQKIERDERRPSRQLAERLAVCLNVPPEEQAIFMQVARGERLVTRLGPVESLPVGHAPLPIPTTPLAGREIEVLPVGRTPLPTPATPLVGRELELIEIGQLLRDPQCRMLTLVGRGGIGKTRLALAAAHHEQSASVLEVAFVPLASIAGREPLINAIAEALGVVLRGADRASQLVSALREVELLLLLDNFEQLLADADAVDVVTMLLNGAPRLKLLVTSREPLRLQAEWVFGVQGLPVSETMTFDALAASSAVRLFVQRARQARVGMALNVDDYIAIGQICRLVDGLPLGIELAAAWVTALSCQEIAQEIQQSVDFLAATARDANERHRSIRAVFNQSWQLLTADEQHILRRLAVFHSGFSRAAAEYVAGASLPMLAALVNKSLLHHARQGRYDLHELVHQYLDERLRADTEEYNRTWERYSSYYTGLLEQRGPAFKGVDHVAVAAELTSDLANFRHSWTWASEHRRADMLTQAADTLFWLYESHSNFREGMLLFGEAAQYLDAADERMRLALGQVLSYQGLCCWRQGQHREARELLEQSHSLLAAQPDTTASIQHARATMMAFRGALLQAIGEHAAGRRMLEESLEMMRALNDDWGIALCLRRLGLAVYSAGEYEEAHQLLTESLELSRAMGNQWSAVYSINFLGIVAAAQGSTSEAERLLRESLRLSTAMNDRFNQAMGLRSLGGVRYTQGNSEEARPLLQESLRIWSEIGDWGNVAETLSALGDVLRAQGEVAEARHCFQEALKLALQTELLPVALEAALHIAAIDTDLHADAFTLAIVLSIHEHPASSKITRTRAEQLLGKLERETTSEQQVRARSTVNITPWRSLALELLRRT